MNFEEMSGEDILDIANPIMDNLPFFSARKKEGEYPMESILHRP